MDIELYMPPECVMCGDRASHHAVTRKNHYCLLHWKALPREVIEIEYQFRTDVFEAQVKALTDKLNMTEAREKGLRDVLKKVDKCGGITAYLSYEKEVDDLLREVSQALAKSTALESEGE